MLSFPGALAQALPEGKEGPLNRPGQVMVSEPETANALCQSCQPRRIIFSVLVVVRMQWPGVREDGSDITQGFSRSVV